LNELFCSTQHQESRGDLFDKEGRQKFIEKAKKRKEQLLKERVGSFYKNKTKYILKERVDDCYYKNRN